MNKGYLIFTVTTANGSIPVENALIELSFGSTSLSCKTDIRGFSERFEIIFESDSPPCLSGSAAVSCPGFKDSFVDKIKVYRNVTVVRIVNLDRIL